MRTNSFSKTFLCLSLLWFCTNGVSAQTMQKFGDNSNAINDKAVLEIESTTKGFLLPRMNKMQRDLINNPPEGLMLWCTDCSLANGSEIVVWIKDSWTNLLISNLGNNTILLGNSSGKATAVTFSGDVTFDNAGESTIGTNKVLSSMISDGTIVSSDIASEAVITSKILDANITNAKLDKTNIPLSGFGPAEADVALGGYKITGLAEPADEDDAATKNYVDTEVKAINILANGKVYLGNASNIATEATLSGDVTVDNAGVSTIGNNKVLSSMINDGTVGTSDMSDNAITNAKILDAAVTDLKISSGINKSKVGLSNVDNSSDSAKPVSNATQAALNFKLDISARGSVNGVASLVSGKIPSDQIPPISFTSVSVVSSESAMRALNGIVGSIAIRTDMSKNYVLSQSDANIPSNWVELLTPAAPVQSVNGKRGIVLLTKTDLVLNDVDNTSDLNKPVSIATKDYVDKQVLAATPDATIYATGKIKLDGDLSGTALLPRIAVNAITSSKLSDYAVTDVKIASGINKSKVGLANVDNTSDFNKPISNTTQNALNLKLDIGNIGLANGAASLDASGKIPSSQIPSIPVSAVKVVNSESEMLALPGVIGTTAIRTDSNKNYILSNTNASLVSNWVELLTPAASIQSVNGKIGAVLLTKTDLSLSNVNNTSDADKELSIAASEALDLKEALSNKSLNLHMDSDSDLKYPSVKAVKTYVDATIEVNAAAETNNRIGADETLALDLESEITRARAVEVLNNTVTSDLQTQLDTTNALENGLILVGDGNNLAAEVVLHGDASLNNIGNLTISLNAIDNDKIQNTSVSYSKIQNVTSNTILGRTTSGTGSVEEIETTGSLKVVLSESPILSGVPEAPTAILSTNTDQIATTSFVLANTDGYKSINASEEIATTSTNDQVVTGMSIIPGAGIYSVMFNGQFVSSSAGTTSRAIADLSAVYQELIAYTTTNSSHAATFGSGETLTAGVYTLGGAGSIAGTLTLNGTANDLFIFKINGALTTAAGTIVNLTGGAQASNVFWVATSAGAMTIASTTKMVGTLFAKNAAATMGSESTLEGRLFSNAGAITVGPSIIKIPLGSSPINLGELNSYALFTSTGAIDNAGISTVTGNIGTNAGAVTGFDSPTTVNGSIFTPSADAGSALTSFSIYQNGTLIANSTRTKTGNNGDVSLLAIAKVLEGQSIDIRWKTSLGQLKLQNRILTLIKVR